MDAKNRFFLIPLVALSLLVVSGETRAQVVDFPDAALSNQVHVALGLPSDADVHVSDLQNLTSLFLGYGGITNISGLEYASNLFYLDLSGNYINDPAPLASLTALYGLVLNDCSLTNASFVSGLTNLSELYLNDNQIHSIPVMDSLVNLFAFEVSRNGCLLDLSRLAALTNLSYLALHSDCISDISFAQGLSQLQSLDVGGDSSTDSNRNYISDISPLIGKNDINSLSLAWNQVTNIPIVAAFTNLYSLFLSSNHFSDLSFITNMTDLAELSINSTAVTNLSLLASHRPLENLDVSLIALSDFTALSGLTNLTQLLIRGNGLTDATLVASLTHLQTLNLSDNELQNIHPLTFLTALEYADLRHNRLDTNALSAAMLDISTIQNQGAVVDFLPQKSSVSSPITLSAPMALGANQFTFNIQSTPGSVLRIWTSSDLSTWNPGGLLTNTSGTIAYTNTSSASHLFFRVQQQ